MPFTNLLHSSAALRPLSEQILWLVPNYWTNMVCCITWYTIMYLVYVMCAEFSLCHVKSLVCVMWSLSSIPCTHSSSNYTALPPPLKKIIHLDAMMLILQELCQAENAGRPPRDECLTELVELGEELRVIIRSDGGVRPGHRDYVEPETPGQLPTSHSPGWVYAPMSAGDIIVRFCSAHNIFREYNQHVSWRATRPAPLQISKYMCLLLLPTPTQSLQVTCSFTESCFTPTYYATVISLTHPVNSRDAFYQSPAQQCCTAPTFWTNIMTGIRLLNKHGVLHNIIYHHVLSLCYVREI